MDSMAFSRALDGLAANHDCVFAFGKSVMRFYSDDKYVGEQERFCPYVHRGVYEGHALRHLFINYPTDVVVARTKSLREVGGYITTENIRFNALLQCGNRVFFTGERCLVSGKFGGNEAGKFAKLGITGDSSIREIGSVMSSRRFCDADRFLAVLLTTAIFSGTSVFNILPKLLADRGDRGYSGFFSIHRESILLELFKTLAGQFPFSTQSVVDNVQPRTHSGNVYCTRQEFFEFRDYLTKHKLVSDLADRPDTAWAFGEAAAL